MKLLSIILALILFSISVTAIELTPTSLDVLTYNNIESPYKLTIKNTYNLPISRIYTEGLNYTSFQTLSAPIQPNETREIYLLIKTNKNVDVTQNGKISFVFISSIARLPKTFYYNVTNNNYPFISIRANDSIQFTNVDSVTRTITSSLWDYLLTPNNSTIIQFLNVGTIDYYDSQSSSGNKINVTSPNQDEEIIRPEDSINFQLHIVSREVATTLELTLYDQNLTVFNLGTKGSVLKIKNIGNTSAQKISIKGNWISFEEEGFNLEPQTEKLVKFTISPSVNTSLETNKSYNLLISALGDNCASINNPILNIFIPYSDVNITDKDYEKMVEELSYLLNYCENHPTSTLWWCNKNATANAPQYIYKNVRLNISEKTIQDISDSTAGIYTSVDTLSQKTKLDSDELKTSLTNINLNQTNQNERLEAIEQSIQNQKGWTIAMIFLLAITVIGTATFLYIRNKREVEGESFE